MNRLLSHFGMLVILGIGLGIMSCSKSDMEPENGPVEGYTMSLQQSKIWLPGKWKLIKEWGMIPSTVVRNVELVIDNREIKVIENGIQIDKVEYEIVKTDYSLKIKTNAQPREDNWYVRDPHLYINKDKMYLTFSGASDGSSFNFSKVY